MFADDMTVHAVRCSTFVMTGVLPGDVGYMVLPIGAVREELIVRLRLVPVSLPTKPGDIRCRSTTSLAL